MWCFLAQRPSEKKEKKHKHTRDLSKHISQPSQSFPIKLDLGLQEMVVDKEVSPHSLG